MEQSSEYIEATKKSFEAALNEHGYSFHQAVLRKFQQLSNQGKSGWSFLNSEFPVEVRSRDTRIDFLMQRVYTSEGGFQLRDQKVIILAAECKRVNPAYGNWCFVQAPYRYRGQMESGDMLHFEQLIKHGMSVMTKGHAYYQPHFDVCHIGLVLSTQAKGNLFNCRVDTGAIEDACGQICKGVNGLVRFYAERPEIWINRRAADVLNEVIFMPVIFTTANLFVSNANLSEANLETGNLEFEDHGFRSVPWLIYQYTQSHGVRHSVPSNSEDADVIRVLQNEFIRSIPIVNASSIEAFLTQFANSQFA